MGRPSTPPIAVDVVIELVDRPERPIVLVERANPPPGWALPGGFVDPGETVEEAAVREMAEETGLPVHLSLLLGVYSAPQRDPRGQTVSVVFVASAVGAPRGGDDAAVARAWDPGAPPPLAFDHADILRDYLQVRGRIDHTRRAAPRRGAAVCAF